MANISTNTECHIEFTEEEKEILQKASGILKDISHEIWHSGKTDKEEDIAFFFSQISGSIDNALKGNYWTP